MASMIKGIPVILYEKTVIGKDEFEHPLYREIPVTIENVLVAPASTTERKRYTILQFRKETITLGRIAGWISSECLGK